MEQEYKNFIILLNPVVSIEGVIQARIRKRRFCINIFFL